MPRRSPYRIVLKQSERRELAAANLSGAPFRVCLSRAL